MTIFSISDLHLSSGDKPMDVFGEHWRCHFEKISADWRERVACDDVVLLPGDFSWAMFLDEARQHLRMVGDLPGRKIMIKGNHDYWWSAIGRVREALPDNMFALQNDSMELNGCLFAGTRGWTLPNHDTTSEDERIYRRELLRLEMTLRSARARSENAPLYCMMHYPPLTDANVPTGFSELLARYRVSDLFYGHLHGASYKGAVRGRIGGIGYHPVSCDGMGFKLYKLCAEA